MNLFSKTAIASIALVGMIQADTMLFGVDAGITVGGARLGIVAGITGGSARSYTAPGYSAYSSCGSSVVSVPVYQPVYHQPVYQTTVVTASVVEMRAATTCDYVVGPCEVMVPVVHTCGYTICN